MRRVSPPLRRTLRPTLLLAGALALAGQIRAQAPPPEIRGVITGETARRIPISVAPLDAASASSAMAAEMRQVLLDDLAYSGYFDLVEPPGAAPRVDPDAPDLVPWRAAGAEAVLVPRVLLRGSQVTLEGRLFDTTRAEMVMGKRFAGESDLSRRVAHRLSNEVVLHFTGQPGIALSRIAFVSRYQGGKELYVMDYDGQRVRRLTTTGSINLSPAWSPDGSRLAFLSFRQKFPAIFVLEADGSIDRLATGGGDLNSSPDWSPDGTKIAYSSSREGNSEIYVMDGVARSGSGSGRERRLTHDPGIDCAPTWSPRGTEIAFTSDRTGSPQIYVMDAEGGNLRRLTYEGRRNDSAAWSPRGDVIAYVSRMDGKFALMVFDLGTQKSSTVLASRSWNCEDPRWSADGRHLVFASDKEGSYDIYQVDLDGSNLRKLTKGVPSYTPDWSR